MNQYLAICAKGLESLLEDELKELGVSSTKPIFAGVYFKSDEKTAMRVCLWTRLASRVIHVLSEFKVQDDLDLYMGCSAISWQKYITPQTSIVVDFNGTNNEIRNSQYGALKVKDAIVDRFTKSNLERPNIAKEDPDLRIHVRLNRENAILGLDMAGSGLHIRGYRTEAGRAPLRENLAAALVIRSGWNREDSLFDPMCGSGTLLIEAAMMAANVAPGLKRRKWGFEALPDFNKEDWLELISEAKVQAKKGISHCATRFWGCDNDLRVLNSAQDNAQRAGVADLISFNKQDAAQLTRPEGFETGHIICNPPYGERLGVTPSLIALYSEFGHRLKVAFKGSKASIYSGSNELLSCIGMRADKQYKINNGALPCTIKNYQITGNADDASSAQEMVFAPDFTNRLKKNIKKLNKWAKKENLDAYRLYDADLPEYNVAIDKYGDYIVIQEYAAPKEIAPEKAKRRLMDAMRATIQVTGVDTEHLVMKTRSKQKGSDQYNKLSQAEKYMTVNEYGATLLVNLYDYLDTGLFLDHRITRHMLFGMAKGKDFLNLFAYTGSATVHAALGGAKSTTTVDMSKTYLAWAERNLQYNGKKGRNHQFIQGDCLQWIKAEKEQYDLIFIDPPTFSNSKRMDTTFDVQRDHVDLLTDLKKLLRSGGTIVFSNNKRHFKMDIEALQALGLSVENISAKTIPEDFARNKQIHNCWIIKNS